MNGENATKGVLNQRIIEGTQYEVMLLEFVTNSGLFWIFDALRLIGIKGLTEYVVEPAHWILLIASLAQTFVMNKVPRRRMWLVNFVAPVLYSAVDILLEGGEFFEESYHGVFWGYALLMAIFYWSEHFQPDVAAVGKGITRTGLLPVMYMLSELKEVAAVSLEDYWFNDSGHFFILMASLLFGILLGISSMLRNRFERALRTLAHYLEDVTTWVFDPHLVARSYEDMEHFALQRVERTILFMDIRGFTSWSEKRDLLEVVKMINAFYSLAEKIISQHGGFKIQMTGDEIMTRFKTAEEGCGRH